MDNTPLPTGKSVLHLVEDDGDWTFIFCEQFRKLAPHWDFVCSEEGWSAIEHLSGPTMPQVLITDINMPGMNGIELIEWIKEQPQFRFLPLFVVSASDNPEDRLRCAKLGIDGYIERPRSLKGLQDCIRYIVKRCENHHYLPLSR